MVDKGINQGSVHMETMVRCSINGAQTPKTPTATEMAIIVENILPNHLHRDINTATNTQKKRNITVVEGIITRLEETLTHRIKAKQTDMMLINGVAQTYTSKHLLDRHKTNNILDILMKL